MTRLIRVVFILGSATASASAHSDYLAKLHEVLALPTFEEETRGADFALRAEIRPSFHPECAVSVIRRGADASMVVRCADDSVWYALVTPALEGKKPKKSVGLVTDRFVLRADEIARLEELARAMPTWMEQRGGLDGMTTSLEVLRGGTRSTLEVWHYGGPADELVRVVTRIINARCSRTARFATNWADYLGGPNPPPGTSRADRYHAALTTFSAASVVLGLGAGVSAWLDRDGVFGRVGAITGGTLGTAFLFAGVAYAIAWSVARQADLGTTVSAVLAGMRAAAIAAAVGLVVGAVGSAFATGPPGDGRGAIGIAGGAVMGATAIIALGAVW